MCRILYCACVVRSTCYISKIPTVCACPYRCISKCNIGLCNGCFACTQCEVCNRKWVNIYHSVYCYCIHTSVGIGYYKCYVKCSCCCVTMVRCCSSACTCISISPCVICCTAYTGSKVYAVGYTSIAIIGCYAEHRQWIYCYCCGCGCCTSVSICYCKCVN